MPQPVLQTEAARLLDRMIGPAPSHRRFVGGPIDWAQIDAQALGEVWTAAQALVRSGYQAPGSSLAADTARAVIDRGRNVAPAFSGPACREYLDYLKFEMEKSGDKADFWLCAEIRFTLSRCIDLTFDGLAEPAEALLEVLEWGSRPHLALALGRLAGREAQVLAQVCADIPASSLLAQELQAAATVDIAAIVAMDRSWHPFIGEGVPDDGTDRLSDDPEYPAFAETALRQAAERVRRIHDGLVPYASDKAFKTEEAEVIGRLARAMLSRDEPWLPPVLDELFRKVSLAPTAAKTLPSQAVAIALAQAIEAFPTPEAVATLRIVLRDMRHAGVKKKLQRAVRGAELQLANRPEVALRLPADQPISRQQLATMARSLEAGLATGMVLGYADWRRFAEHPQTTGLAGSVLWRVVDAGGAGPAVLPVIERGVLVLRDVAGAPVAAPDDGRMMLWHPCTATAEERDAWRDRVAALRIKQPFKQVFREHYAVPADELAGTATAMFAGHTVSVRPFLGLARRERWKDGYECLTRAFGRWTVTLDLADNIYPGRGGSTNTGKLSVRASRSELATPVHLDDLPAAMLSEILRSVDLLVSVGGFALGDISVETAREMRLWRLADEPLGAMAEMRKRTLRHALGAVDGLQFDARHLRIGTYAVHLATGRVTRDGDPVTIDLPQRPKLSAVPWLPYDEKLLETIYYTAVEIMDRGIADDGGSI